MSAHLTTYLGPCILADYNQKPKETKIFSDKYFECLEQNCKKYKFETEGKFCNFCGKIKFPIGKIIVECFHMNDLMGDRLIDVSHYHNNHNIDYLFIPNIASFGFFNEAEAFIDIKQINIEKEIEKFSSEFQKEIGLIRLHLLNVRINFGLVNYYL